MRFSSKIALSAVATALIIGPLFGTAVFLEARSLLLERIVQNQTLIAAGVMEKIDGTLFAAYKDINSVAFHNFLREFLESPSLNKGRADMVLDELEKRVKSTGPWEGLTVFDRNGRIVFSLKGIGGIGALADSSQTRLAFERASGGKTYYSDRIVSHRTGRPVVIFAVPIFGRDDPGKVVGVIVSHYVWTPIQTILAKVEAPAMVYLLNSKGEVIGQHGGDHLEVRPGAEQVRNALRGNEAGYFILPHSIQGGEASLVVDVRQKGMKDYRGNGWMLMVEMPLSVTFAPIVTLARNTGLLVFGALLVMAALFALVGRSFIRPLGELVKGVRQVAGGKFDEKVEVHSNDEFGELADDFNIMVDKLRDRTRQLLEAQDELVRNEKSAMMGRIAANVGNELRNPLGVMNNAVFYLQAVLPDADPTIQDYLGIIHNEIVGSVRIVSDLLDAVQTAHPNPKIVDVAELVDQIMGKYTVPASITLRLDIAETIQPVYADTAQVQRAIGNLVINGIDAMPEGGTLTIRATDGIRAGTVVITIQDTGTGIPPEIMPKLFQPLFSTKSRGIGLGLLVAKNLISANNGTISVQSKVGEGTAFTIILPAGNDSSEIPSQTPM